MTRLKTLHKRTLIIAIVLVLAGLITAGIATAQLVTASNAEKNQTAKDGTSPAFRALLPKNKSIDDLGGWKKQSPPNGEPYFVFLDSINGTPIRVSQQALPNTLKEGTDSKIIDLAKGFNANQTLDADGKKVYIGTSAKGPQSVIFTRNGLLLLVVSEQIIPDDAWVNYLRSLT